MLLIRNDRYRVKLVEVCKNWLRLKNKVKYVCVEKKGGGGWQKTQNKVHDDTYDEDWRKVKTPYFSLE